MIIAGAGPAGTLAAYELARLGVSVLILEKSGFPRYKVCGSGLTHKILAEIPYSLDEILETEIHTFIFSSEFREVFCRTNENPLIYCTMRDKLDAFLLARSLEAGATVEFGQHVMNVVQDQHGVIVKTKTGSYRSALLIGSDGASGNVSRIAGLKKDIMPGLAWEAEIETDPAIVSQFSQTVFLDWGSFPGGYGWVFPKADHFSIGVGGPAHLSKWMMPYYRKYLDFLEGQFNFTPLKVLSLKAWPIPVRIRKSDFHNGRILVAGDAAGLTDPLTGEGIYYAVRSGRLAAMACSRFLEARQGTLKSFTESVNDELMPELLEANRIKYIFNTVPLKIHLFVRDSDRGWRAFGKVLRGERWYADVRAGFGKWKFLWRLATAIAHLFSNYKERKFSKDGFSGPAS